MQGKGSLTRLSCYRDWHSHTITIKGDHLGFSCWPETCLNWSHPPVNSPVLCIIKQGKTQIMQWSVVTTKAALCESNRSCRKDKMICSLFLSFSPTYVCKWWFSFIKVIFKFFNLSHCYLLILKASKVNMAAINLAAILIITWQHVS